MGEPEDCRLWVGNLDSRCSEYQLLKLLQKHGKIDKFDYLFHKAGPLAGQPRGYAFVTYHSKEDALKAKEKLHNCLLGSKNIVVTWANSIPVEETQVSKKNDLNIPALALSKPSTKLDDKRMKIQAIEAKLKLMEYAKERHDNSLEINKTVASERPVITPNPPITNPSNSDSIKNKYYNVKKQNERKYARNRPYNKSRTRR